MSNFAFLQAVGRPETRCLPPAPFSSSTTRPIKRPVNTAKPDRQPSRILVAEPQVRGVRAPKVSPARRALLLWAYDT